MSKLSRQDLVNMTHKFYADGGETGSNGYGCVYFKGDNGRCAIGVVLSHLGIERSELVEESDGEEQDHNEDDDARDIIEFLGDRLTDHLESDVFAKDRKIDRSKETFLLRLQKAHDDAAQNDGDSDDVAESIAHFAEVEKLTVPE